MNLILIATHINYMPDEVIVGFRLFDKETRQFVDATYDSAFEKIASGQVTVDGIEIENGKLKGSNGAFDRYTTLVNGRSFGSCPLVITKEFPNKIYEVVNYVGQIANMTTDSIIQYANSEGIANAKIIIKDDKQFISRITGEFEKDKSFKDLEAGKGTKAKMKLVNATSYNMDDNYYAYCECVESEQPEELSLGRGCLGVKPNGFKGNRAKVMVLPSTCTNLGVRSFANMANLEKIVLAEGTTKIPNFCFENCASLCEIDLPNSVIEIGANAFKGCRNLKVIRTGPKKPLIAYGAVPSGTKLMPRR